MFNKDSLRHGDRRRVWVKEAKDDIEETYRERPLLLETQREVGPCNRDVWRSNVRSASYPATWKEGH